MYKKLEKIIAPALIIIGAIVLGFSVGQSTANKNKFVEKIEQSVLNEYIVGGMEIKRKWCEENKNLGEESGPLEAPLYFSNGDEVAFFFPVCE
jgi:hypothetical protein